LRNRLNNVTPPVSFGAAITQIGSKMTSVVSSAMMAVSGIRMLFSTFDEGASPM
jgi:hypothetical protein